MKLHFDPNQGFQLDAVAAVVDLFDGQPQGAPDYSVIRLGDLGGLFAGQDRTDLGIGNALRLGEEQLCANTRRVQLRNDIEVDAPEVPLDAWEHFDLPANAPRPVPHFSFEMETGTGKDLRLPAHDLRAVPALRAPEVRNRGAERRDPRGRAREHLSALPVRKSVYEYGVYHSEIEREFARRLDEREDIRLFVKLPRWFLIETPLGSSDVGPGPVSDERYEPIARRADA